MFNELNDIIFSSLIPEQKKTMENIAWNARNENLQILRFAAAALVLATHITFYIHERIDSKVDIWPAGGVGVSLFFVISGFVMYLQGNKLPRNFYGARYFLSRRVARVFPLYWVVTTLKVVVAIIAPAVVLHNRPELLNTLASYLLFPMLNKEGGINPIHGVGWTLLHEMFFYYTFALSLLFRQSPFLCSSFIIIFLWFIGLFVPAEYGITKIVFSEINLLFVAGMVLAACHKHGFRFSRSMAFFILLGAISIRIVPALFPFKLALFGSFDIEVVFIVAASLSINFSKLPKLRAMFAHLGDSSYSLYLVHPMLAPAICLLLFKLSIQSVFLIFPLAFIFSIVASHFIFKYIEHPLNRSAGNLLTKPLRPQVA